MTKFDTYMQALLWTCKHCGFAYEGGQPKQNCPVCESYKTSFIDIPQHIEAQVREEYPDKSFNHVDCREMRKKLMKESGADDKNRVSGRFQPTKSGTNIEPS